MSRVLIVEDEAHLAQGLRFNLEAEGHSVDVVGDGEAALDRLLTNKQQFDAVVLDAMLPGKDGFAVASELRASKNYVPVLMFLLRELTIIYPSRSNLLSCSPVSRVYCAGVNGCIRVGMPAQKAAASRKVKQILPRLATMVCFPLEGRPSISVRCNFTRMETRFNSP